MMWVEVTSFLQRPKFHFDIYRRRRMDVLESWPGLAQGIEQTSPVIPVTSIITHYKPTKGSPSSHPAVHLDQRDDNQGAVVESFINHTFNCWTDRSMDPMEVSLLIFLELGSLSSQSFSLPPYSLFRGRKSDAPDFPTFNTTQAKHFLKIQSKNSEKKTQNFDDFFSKGK